MSQGRLSHSPASTATRFRSKRNASARPIAECRPRSGEKPMRTPRPKAAAVRCGVSWMWRSDSSDRSAAFFVRCHMASEVDEARPERFPATLPVEPDARDPGEPAYARDREIARVTHRLAETAQATTGHGQEELVVLATGKGQLQRIGGRPASPDPRAGMDGDRLGLDDRADRARLGQLGDAVGQP